MPFGRFKSLKKRVLQWPHRHCVCVSNSSFLLLIERSHISVYFLFAPLNEREPRGEPLKDQRIKEKTMSIKLGEMVILTSKDR
jgi:hypothetical protein